MRVAYGPTNVPVTDLPETLFPAGSYTTLGGDNSPELDILCAKPQQILPLPANLSESKQRQLSGLAQYRGKTAIGRRRSLANLPRRIRMENLTPITISKDPKPELPPGAIVPTPPTMIPKVPAKHTTAGKYLRHVLSQEEARLFEETFVDWFSAHPEWVSPEDRDDLMTICMETVVMFRLQRIEKQAPGTDIHEKYNTSYRRKQNARENLMARRRDNQDIKGQGSKKIPNIAVMAGEFSPEKLAQMQAEERVRAAQEEEDFLSAPAHPLAGS